MVCLSSPNLGINLGPYIKPRAGGKGELPHPRELVTNELKGLFEVLPQVLLVAISGRQPLVVEEAFLVVVQREMSGDVHDVADVEPLHGV